MSDAGITTWRQCAVCRRGFRYGATERPRYCSLRCAAAREQPRAPRPAAVGA